jgi:hypothetical protein
MNGFANEESAAALIQPGIARARTKSGMQGEFHRGAQLPGKVEDMLGFRLRGGLDSEDEESRCQNQGDRKGAQEM